MTDSLKHTPNVLYYDLMVLFSSLLSRRGRRLPPPRPRQPQPAGRPQQAAERQLGGLRNLVERRTTIKDPEEHRRPTESGFQKKSKKSNTNINVKQHSFLLHTIVRYWLIQRSSSTLMFDVRPWFSWKLDLLVMKTHWRRRNDECTIRKINKKGQTARLT